MYPAKKCKHRQAVKRNTLRRSPPLKIQALLALGVFFLSACQTAPEYRTTAEVIEPSVGITSDHNKKNIILPDVAGIPASTEPGLPPTKTVARPVPWLSTIKSEFALAKTLVEKELDVDLGEIELKLVNDQPINAEVALETQRLVKEQFGQTAFADHFLEQVMSPLSGTYAALYSARLGAVMISRSMLASYERSLPATRGEPFRRAALLTLLIHELVHAADDLRYQIHDNRALNFRASFAQSATFEGHAQWATRRICAKAGCSEGLTALDDFMFSTDLPNSRLTQPVQAISRSVLEYSYIEGERFVTQLAKRDNGEQLIQDLLRTPPQDPIQILSPDTFPDVVRENLNQRLIMASRSVNHPLTIAPWIGVETSPLKGVDLRADPSRRQAAIDGFTKLIRGMVSVQFYDQQTPGAMPVEATLLQAESSHTARLFATMLHGNTQQSGAQVSDEPLVINSHVNLDETQLDLHIFRTAIDADTSYRTSIAVAGEHVVQVSANISDQDLLDEYVILVLLELNES